ncbi:MAG: flagellar hook-length control protein FliK [Burkholderiaceae bacterium]
MSTPTISAVSPLAPSNAGRTQGGGASEPETATPFSAVLTRQQGAESQRGAPKDAKSQDAAMAPADAGKNQPTVADKNPSVKKEDDAALAETSGEPGPTLPQIALTIAAEVAAVQQASMAAGKPAAQTADPRRQAGLDSLTAGRGNARSNAPAPLAALADKANAGGLDAAARLATPSRAAHANIAGQSPVNTAEPTLADLAGRTVAVAIDSQAAIPAAPAPLLGASKAASLAGVRQAVLTMQARNQALESAEARPGSLAVPVLTPNPAAVMASDFSTAVPAANLSAAHIGSLAAGQPGLAATAGIPTALAGNGLPTTPSAIGAPLQSPQWGPEFGRQFVSIAQGGHNMPHTAELRLDPPELGPLRITININDNIAHATFVSPHASVRQAVENAMSQLQQSLAQAGISLGQTSVSDQGQPQQAFNENPGGGSGRHTASGDVAGLEGPAALPTARSRAADALVDTFA